MSNLSESFRQALWDIGITYYEGMGKMRAEDIQIGDVLVRPGSSVLCWEVVEPPVEDGRSIKLFRCVETRRGERLTNRRSFTFRREEELKVMRLAN